MPSIRFSLRRTLALGAVTAAAASIVVLATGGAAVARRATVANSPLCQTPGLVVWLDTAGNAALGTVFYELEFTNLSGHTCTLNGFPFLFAVGLNGHQIGSHVTFGHSGGGTHTVTLANGHTATAKLGIVEVANFPAATCKRVTAAGLRVFPPNQTTAKTVPYPFRACSASGPKFLSVQPVK